MAQNPTQQKEWINAITKMKPSHPPANPNVSLTIKLITWENFKKYPKNLNTPSIASGVDSVRVAAHSAFTSIISLANRQRVFCPSEPRRLAFQNANKVSVTSFFRDLHTPFLLD